MPSIRRFSWGRNVFLAYGQEPQSRRGGMQWTRSRQSISKERLPQEARGWRVWSRYGPLGLAFILGWGWAADTLGQGRAPTEKALKLEPVVVTATVAPTPLGRTTAPVTVIAREQIAAQQATSAATRPRCAPLYHRGWHSTGFINSYRGQDARRLRSGDLAVNWTLTRHCQVFVAVDDLFDAAYEEFIGFPAPGVSPHAGVRTSF
jgi:hypothetical protein